MFARECETTLRSLLSTPSTSETSDDAHHEERSQAFEILFHTPLTDYDVLIKLDKHALPQYSHSITYAPLKVDDTVCRAFYYYYSCL